jgi:hypothetical protein
MGPVRAFIRRMTHQNPIVLVIAGAAVLIVVLALSSAVNRGGQPADAPIAAGDPDAQTAPASGVPPENGGQADIIPPDEGGDEQGAADAPAGANTATPPAP